jgi:hypothetical protein
MDTEIVLGDPDPEFLGAYLASLPDVSADAAHESAGLIREDHYNGHHIVVETTYTITVDGRPLNIHVGVYNDGTTDTHGLPNYQFGSVVDMVRTLIDMFPHEFTHEEPGGPGGGHPGGHQHGAQHGGSGGE